MIPRLYLYSGISFIVVVVLGIGFALVSKHYYDKGYNKATYDITNQWHKEKAILEQSLNDLKQKTHSLEQQNQQLSADVLFHINKEKENTRDEADALVNNLDTLIDGMSVEVRSEARENTCPAPDTAGTAHKPAKRTTAKLSKDFAKALVREAERADRIVIELNACKVLLKNVYKQVEQYNLNLEQFNQDEK